MAAFCEQCSCSFSAFALRPVLGPVSRSSFPSKRLGTIDENTIKSISKLKYAHQILPHYDGAKAEKSFFTSNGIVIKTKATLLSARKLHSRPLVMAGIEQFTSEDFEVEKMLGTYGYMKVSSYTPQSGDMFGVGLSENIAAGLDSRDISQMRGQEIIQGNVQTRLYIGRIARGYKMGTRVILKAYPGQNVGGKDADIMAANELSSHALLQDPSGEEVCPNLTVLLGGFQTKTGEQWLVFRDDGRLTAAHYAKAASEATVDGRAVGEWDFWDRFDCSRPIQRRRIFITKLLRGTFTGLSFMHSRGRLHQSLGPASVLLNTMEERDCMFLVPRLRDLAFAADVSDRAIFGTAALESANDRQPSSSFAPKDVSVESAAEALSEGLWRRASAAGARMAMERKAFGLADDIYAGGLLLAYIVFVSLSDPGSIDGPSLQRLLENTFRLDIQAAREYCSADDRWTEAVKFLELDDGAGWQLLQVMLNPDFRQRPIADAVLNHRFLTEAIL